MSTYISEACEFCLADAGEPCAEDCVGYQPDEAQVEFSDLEFPEDSSVTRPLDESLSILAENVHRLPFGNLVGVRGMGAPDRQDYDADEYIARLALWMEEYQPILRAEVDALQAQAKRAISLEFERDVVRNFFGKVTQ
jgi:hypothetical protein